MFPCTQCGLCCQNISGIKELKDYDLGNGLCKYFNTETKSCDIYNSRPDICRIDKMYEIEFCQYFTKKEYYFRNATVCNELQKKHNINIEYRIKLGE